ncbi:PqiB family protein [Gallaecimonas xiamenensis]|uniref:Mce-like protein n=1 Tax=Gallaecimonas xiamenensis 3-C-1 TaxID=745411 RepID=K2K470_9GAMM|nr:MlaD family protein [Gallaecimonas xiamenensis]EKE72200.1 mce-like protein [Gallaecimonas xiamenensis 3-C-1]
MKKTAVKLMDKPDVRKVKRLSLVWVVPLVALALAGYLIYQQFVERGLSLTLAFPEAKGLVPGKTELRYQGFKVGVVSHLSFDAQSGQFNAHISAMRDLEPLLKENTQFWLVKPKASLLGVSGLDTLLSGNYIAMLPGDGKGRRHFVARRTPPPEPVPDGVFMVELALRNLGSLSEGSPVYYRRVPIGEVHSYRLDKEAGAVVLQLTFNENYADLVRRDSHFKDVSGIKVQADLSGIKVDSQGLVPMLTGGLLMDSPGQSPKADYGQRFVLAQERRFNHQVHLNLQNPTYLPKGTPIIARQKVIGEVVDSNDSGVLLGFNDQPMDPFYAWVAERSLKDLQVETLLHPRYVRLLQGMDGRHLLHNTPPLPGPADSELLVRVLSPRKVADGTPIQYKGFTVGEVIYSHLDGDKAYAELSIQNAYRHLVTKDAQFSSAQPLRVDASFQKFKLSAEPLENWWQGAIELSPGQQEAAPYNSLFELDKDSSQPMQQLTLTATPPQSLPAGTPVRRSGFTVGQVLDSSLDSGGQSSSIRIAVRKDIPLDGRARFYWQAPLSVNASLKGLSVKVPDLESALAGSIILADTGNKQAKVSHVLYPDKDSALVLGPLVQLWVPADTEIQAGVPIKYLGYKVGEVKTVTDVDDGRQLQLAFDGELAKRFGRKGSQFSLVTPSLSLAGISHLDALLGTYLAVMPAKDKQAPVQLAFTLSPALYPHKEVVLAAPSAASLVPGAPVWYRDLPVGEVLDISLMPSGDGVFIRLAIRDQAAAWVTSRSRFWLKAGFKASFGFLDGFQVEANTLQSIAQGGIQFATQGGGQAIVSPLPLEPLAPDGWLDWSPEWPAQPAAVD